MAESIAGVGPDTPEKKNVRVSYVPTGHGLALSIDDEPTEDAGDETTAGVLHISDAIMTLELPMADGRPAVLAWDPAEVAWDSMVA